MEFKCSTRLKQEGVGGIRALLTAAVSTSSNATCHGFGIQGPSRDCNESKEKEKKVLVRTCDDMSNYFSSEMCNGSEKGSC
jgi:hypothetical protein